MEKRAVFTFLAMKKSKIRNRYGIKKVIFVEGNTFKA